MRLKDWNPALGGRAAPTRPRPPLPVARVLYRLRVLCRPTVAERLRAQIGLDAQLHRLTLLPLVACVLPDSDLVQLSAHVQVAPGPAGVAEARRGLVALVQRLGLEPQVRSVRWESVPQPAAVPMARTH